MLARGLYKTFGRQFDPVAFAGRLQASGYSAAALAERLDFQDDRVVRCWVLGTKAPGMSNLMTVCDLLGCSINDIAPKIGAAPPAELTPEQLAVAETRRIHSAKRRARYFQPGRD